MRILRRWRDLVASLGESLIEVAEAEVASLKQDLRHTGRRFGMAIALAVVAAIMAFWVVGAAGFALFQVLLLWVPGWGASLIVLGSLLTLALILGGVARRRLRDLEAPIDTMRRHVEDHKDWWRNNLLPRGDSDDRSEIADRDETEFLP
jgi:Flp pilus assembly protein protease CpaA